MRSLALPLLLLLAGCTGPEDLCTRHYEPFPDLIGGRARTDANAALLDAMARYNAGDHAAAIPVLEAELRDTPNEEQIRMLLASALLGAGKPYDAELQLDFIETSARNDYDEAAAWYTVLCWLCSGQHDRALEGARAIAARPRHSYKRQADALVKDLMR
ncbi:MAG: hypothetical protein IPM49_02935 [Flavobacteriales bacterium]|nr:hypothetical protein [Flavobacteriales bacterium]